MAPWGADYYINPKRQLMQVLKGGRYPVEAGNIPGIEGLIRRAVGSNSPIRLDVWFINEIEAYSMSSPVVESATNPRTTPIEGILPPPPDH